MSYFWFLLWLISPFIAISENNLLGKKPFSSLDKAQTRPKKQWLEPSHNTHDKALSDKEKGFKPSLISPHQVKKGSAFLAGIYVQMPPGWHSYWSFAGDFGQAPQILFDPLEHVQFRLLPFPTPKRKLFPINKKPAYSFVYEKEFLIPFEVFIEESYPDTSLPLDLNLRWFVCKDVCFPKENKLTLDLKIGSSFKTHSETKKIFDFYKPLFPQSLHLESHYVNRDSYQILHFAFKEKEIQCVDVFPLKAMDFSTTKPSFLKGQPYSCSFQVKKSHSPPPYLSGLLLYSQKGETRSTLFQSHKRQGLIFWFALMAFIGGLLLNIMPCVLPIIFLKFYSIFEFKSLQPKKILFLNLSYVFGILSSFLLLAFVVFFSKQAGESLGWGFHLQSPVFVLFLAFLFVFMAFCFLDKVSFPSVKAPLLFKSQKAFPHFLTGVLSTTSASPCTVPFMASAVGFAFSRSYIEVFVIFLFLGLGLSTPYLILSFFPGFLKYVPRPGHWTEKFKHWLSLPLFLTALWLIWILYLQVDFKLFLLSLTIFPLLWLWIFLQNFVSSYPTKRILNFIFAFLAIVFFIGQSLFFREGKALKPVRPPAQKSLNWNDFEKEKILFDKQTGKNILVVFGAEWCLTCKLNERIFHSQEFKKWTQKNQIHLYYGDWTSQNPEMTQFLESYGQAGVPFYIFFQGEEKFFIFPTLLFKDSFLKDLKRLSQ